MHELSTITIPDLEAARANALREDRSLVLEADRVILVPYRPEHIGEYHSWMKDPELLELTGSEPLTLEEEVEMQRKWANDTDKATLIILERGTPDTPGTGVQGGRMVGDVNLFLYDKDDPSEAEMSVMIARGDARRRGLARDALRAMMRYGYTRLGVRRFVAKINQGNHASLALFQALGFAEESFSTAFRQHALVWTPASRHDITLSNPLGFRLYDRAA